MNTKILKLTEPVDLVQSRSSVVKNLAPLLIFVLLIILWCLTPVWLRHIDKTVGEVDQSILLLIILSLICFLLLIGISWWLLQRFWRLMKLPPLKMMVSLFNTLTLWQQLSFYWASFALLLLVALGCLTTIC